MDKTAEERKFSFRLPSDLADWAEDRAAEKHPRKGRGGYVSALVRSLLERERRRVERRAK